MTQSLASSGVPMVREKGSAGRLALLLPVALYLGTVLVCAPHLCPDGYDGVGFVLALDHFDLSHFQPQPPGYPLFLLLGKFLRLFGLSGVAALSAVNALLLGSGLLGAAALVEREAGALAGWSCALLLFASPLCFGLGTSTLSDGAGLGAVLLSVTAGVYLGLGWGGLLFGLALGIRPSLLPLLLPLFWLTWRQTGTRGLFRALLGVSASVLAWLLPLLCIVGPRAFIELSLRHVHGHVYEYGGTLATDSAWGTRLWTLGQGLFFGAVGPAWPFLIGVLLWASFRVRGRGLGALGKGGLLVLFFWSLWVLIAQQPRGSGRHLLPAVVALLMLSVLLVHRAFSQTGVRVSLLGLLLLLCAVPSARMIKALRTEPTAGAALAGYVAAHYPAGTALYGARKARYLDWLVGPGAARPALYLGDVIVDLEHRDRPPAEALLTSEVRAAPASRPRMHLRGHFCTSDAVPALLRFDQQAGDPECLDLYSYSVWP